MVEKTIADRKEVLETLAQMMRGERKQTQTRCEPRSFLLRLALEYSKTMHLYYPRSVQVREIKRELERRLGTFIRMQQSDDLVSKELALFGHDQPCVI